MPRCKKCGYSTDDIEDFIDHVIQERSPEAEKPRPRHRSVDEAKGFLKCPECRKSFVQAAKEDPKFLGEIKPEPKPEEKKPRGMRLFERRKEG